MDTKRINICRLLLCLFPFLIYCPDAVSGVLFSPAREADTLFFGNGSRVCFVGNSITNNGEFHHNILLYHITRFPGINVTFFNCGISGDVTGGILKRMEDDILIHKPTHAVIMIGMNDVRRNLYVYHRVDDKDTLRMRQEALDIYRVNLEKIIKIFLSGNIKVILQKPSVYDQTAIQPTFNNFGVNDALFKCAGYADELSVKYNLPVVDYWTIMNRLNGEMQKNDPAATITGRDRVHPDATGHLVMAYQFLKTESAPQYVSRIVIDKNVKISSQKSANCQIRSVSGSRDRLRFTVRENSLPFPVVAVQQKALDLVPFTKGFNMEILQVSAINPGKYELSIDNGPAGTFSADSLKAGINLAELNDAPQYKQALKVRSILAELWKLEANLRTLKFIEYNQFYKDCPDKENLDAVKNYLDSVFTVKYDNPYYKARLADYLKNKPFESGFIMKSDSLRDEAFKSAQPVDHLFVLRKLN